MDALLVMMVQFHNLTKMDEPRREWVSVRMTIHTPPDLGILTTVSPLLYILCISTLSFSWPTTRIILTNEI